MPRTPSVLLGCLAAGAVVLAGGCGFHVRLGDGDSASPTTSASAASSLPSAAPSGASAVPSGEPSSSPAPTPSPTRSKKLTAKDGTNVAACRDGRCEVLVKRAPRPIPVAAKFGADNLTVKKIGNHQVTFTTHSGDGFRSRITTGVGGTATINTLVIEVVDVRGHAAAIRLHPK